MKPLSECSFETALELWNRGFSGYSQDMTRTMDSFLAYLTGRGIQPENSISAFVDGKPAGFVLLAVKELNGKKKAWNGGTGVSSEFRGLGIGKLLIKEAVALLAKQEVSSVYLEVQTSNHSAIAIYQSNGFEIVSHAVGLKKESALHGNAILHNYDYPYHSSEDEVSSVSQLPFYNESAAWSSQWHALKECKALLVHDQNLDKPVGYALFRRVTNARGNPTTISIQQCEADPARTDVEAIIRYALAALYSPLDVDCTRTASNITNEAVVRCLEEAGFTRLYEQHVMELKIDEGASRNHE